LKPGSRNGRSRPPRQDRAPAASAFGRAGQRPAGAGAAAGQHLSPAEIGNLLESLPPGKREVVWGLVDAEDDGEVLVHVGDEVRESLIADMDPDELVARSRTSTSTTSPTWSKTCRTRSSTKS
jgi:hypothetical protein